MVQAALDNGEVTVENKNALNRQLCTSLYACTDKVTKSERDHVAMRLVKKYPCLKSPVGAGHVSTNNILLNFFLVLLHVS
jgi:hypothetical protein